LFLNNRTRRVKEIEDISDDEWELTFRVNIHFLSDQGDRSSHEGGQCDHQYGVGQFRSS
jgi:hypothetical protein